MTGQLLETIITGSGEYVFPTGLFPKEDFY